MVQAKHLNTKLTFAALGIFYLRFYTFLFQEYWWQAAREACFLLLLIPIIFFRHVFPTHRAILCTYLTFIVLMSLRIVAPVYMIIVTPEHGEVDACVDDKPNDGNTIWIGDLLGRLVICVLLLCSLTMNKTEVRPEVSDQAIEDCNDREKQSGREYQNMSNLPGIQDETELTEAEENEPVMHMKNVMKSDLGVEKLQAYNKYQSEFELAVR